MSQRVIALSEEAVTVPSVKLQAAVEALRTALAIDGKELSRVSFTSSSERDGWVTVSVHDISIKQKEELHEHKFTFKEDK